MNQKFKVDARIIQDTPVDTPSKKQIKNLLTEYFLNTNFLAMDMIKNKTIKTYSIVW